MDVRCDLCRRNFSDVVQNFQAHLRDKKTGRAQEAAANGCAECEHRLGRMPPSSPSAGPSTRPSTRRSTGQSSGASTTRSPRQWAYQMSSTSAPKPSTASRRSTSSRGKNVQVVLLDTDTSIERDGVKVHYPSRSTFSGPSLGATDSHQASRHAFPTGVDTRRRCNQIQQRRESDREAAADPGALSLRPLRCAIRKMFIRLDLSCSGCRQPRLLDGAYQCILIAGSLDEACGQLLCNSCSRAHSSATSHPCFRVVGLDSRVMAGVIDCPHRCGANLTPANYMKHARSCNLRELMCPMPMCRQKPFFWNTLVSHLIDHHGFFNENTTYEGYKEDIPLIRCGTGVVLEGQEEYFVFFIAETGLYFVWLGDAEAKPDFSSFMLKVYLYQAGPDGRPREEIGHYLSPHPARVMDVIHLCMIASVANVNITQQSFYLRVLIEDRA